MSLLSLRVKNGACIKWSGSKIHQRSVHPCGGDSHYNYSRELEHLRYMVVSDQELLPVGKRKFSQQRDDLAFGTESG